MPFPNEDETGTRHAIPESESHAVFQSTILPCNTLNDWPLATRNYEMQDL